MNKKFSMIILMALALVLASQSVFATVCGGGTPHFFYGNVKIDGVNAPIGTEIRSVILNSVRSIYTTTTVGQYGNPNSDDKLGVPGLNEGYEVNPQIFFEVKVGDTSWVPTILNGSLQSFTYFCGNTDNLDLNAQTGGPSDSDHDGDPDSTDCSDFNSSIHHGAAEVCNGVDDDCDSQIDEGDDSLCNDNQFCNGQEVCNGATGCAIVSVPNCNDGVACTVDSCNEVTDSCNNVPNNALCDDGLFCNGVETCTLAGCVPGTAFDCSSNDIGAVNSCTNNPDNNPLTLDTRAAFTSTCDENTDSCTTGSTTVTSVCDATCAGGPVCDENADCGITDCDVLDGCLGETTTYRDYTADAANTCNSCQCQAGVCSTFNDIPNDPRCVSGCPDDDVDGVCNNVDVCPGHDDNQNSDSDSLPDGCDACPLDQFNDADGDGVCGNVDTCPGSDDHQDSDGDTVADGCDVCPGFDDNGPNTDLDEFPNACDPDDDGDLINDTPDNCPLAANPLQEDSDHDGIGDACDSEDNDGDDDGTPDDADNCPLISNDQTNSDGDSKGDACDNCQGVTNEDQLDTDHDGAGDACEVCDTDETATDDSIDNDGVCPKFDNCDAVANENQENHDNDALGDACDTDDDNDGIPDDGGPGACTGGNTINCDDNCPLVSNPGQDDFDGDGIGFACDPGDLAPEEIFNQQVEIFNGWTVFSLPFDPIDVSNSEDLGQAIIGDIGANCDVMMRFNGATQLMEDDLLGLADPTFPLSATQAYFIHCSAAGTFTYQGTVWS